jgi:hypothetical protein
MALEFYVEQADRSPQSGVANESIYAGELIHDDGDGVDALAFADGNENVGLARYDAEAMAAEWEEDIVEEVYDTGQRVQYQPSEDSAILRVRTIEDTAAPAPNISHRDVVGIVDETNSDAPADARGRVVEEGYSTDLDGDTTTTTFNRTNGNFKAVGVAYRPGQRAGEAEDRYDHPVRVIMFSELKE